MAKDNIILIKTYDFAVEIVRLCRLITAERKEYVLSKQLLRSGTSIGANAEEGAGGFTKKDFRAKMSIAYKEARESSYWLRLMRDTKLISEDEFNNIHPKCEEILKILFSIIKNSK
ncbi:MAG: four helix bundle protein [Cyclobacteriaceae bacterium]